MYTNSGIALLALAANATHKLWKWQRTDNNPKGQVGPRANSRALTVQTVGRWVLCFLCIVLSCHPPPLPSVCVFLGQATASVSPQLWQPSSGSVMTNDTSDAGNEETGSAPLACVALSKNDSYVMSASGGKVSLFNLLTFKVRLHLDEAVTAAPVVEGI